MIYVAIRYMQTRISPYTIIAEMMTMITSTRPSKTPPTMPPVTVSERLPDVDGAVHREQKLTIR